MEGLIDFLTIRHGSGYGSGYGYGYGSGYGSGDGYGSGSGSGYGSGYGSGSGDGSGDGYGSGSGSGYGSGDGSGYGYGSGDGYGSGSGSGSGDGSGLKQFNGEKVHHIDRIPTVLLSVKGFEARGFIIKKDLTTKACYIVRVGNSFAHGETIERARQDAESKHLLESPVEERIDLFLSAFSKSSSIKARDLYHWHFKLTGSCSFGRDEFVKEHGINLDKDEFTVDQFIELTINSYGGNVIRQLKEAIKLVKV